ncbi:MAG: SdrD B-like domain-containing protein, partial [Candidatus Limnocylindria bacterium]
DIPDWSWKDAEPEDKNDITNAYAAAYFATAGPDAGDLILYFGVDRMANNGDAAVGVWFLQSGVSQTDICQGPNCEFSGAHVPGDILVQSDFTTGGTVERLDVYMWDCDTFFGSQTDCENEFSTGSFTPVNAGGDLWRIFEGVDCDIATAGDLACANVNSTVEDAPWDYSYKCVGTNQPDECDGFSGVQPLDVFPISTFFEGGVNLTDTLGEDICLATFIAETRSSQSETSTLDDKALGTFDLCGTKSGTKYEDPDGDGDLADGVALDGWTITLYEDDGNGILEAGDTFLDSAVTGDGDWADGYYEFPDLFPGDYIVCEVLQTDWFQSAPDPGTADCSFDPTLGPEGYAFTIQQGIDETGNDFGNFQQGTKSGTKYEDENANGIDDGAGDAGLVGWTIKAFNDNDSSGTLNAGDTLAATDVTDATGAYSFSLDPGDYVVCEVLQANWTQSEPSNAICDDDTIDATVADGGYAVTITSGSSEPGNDFGNFQVGTKSGHKYEDENANGADDGAGDANLAGWTIKVFNDNDNSNTLNAGDTLETSMVTAAVTGAYSFSLDPGEYVVCEVLQATWAQSEPSNTICDFDAIDATLADGGYPVTITSGSSEPGN